MEKGKKKKTSLDVEKPSIFPLAPYAWTVSGLSDFRSITLMAIVGALYCILRFVFVGVGGSGIFSIRPADALWMMAVLFGYPWAAGLMIGGFVSSLLPMFGGYGLVDALKEIPLQIPMYVAIFYAYKKFDPQVKKDWFFWVVGLARTTWSMLYVGVYLYVLYQMPIVAFFTGSAITAYLNEVLVSYLVVKGLKAAGAHFLPMKNG